MDCCERLPLPTKLKVGAAGSEFMVTVTVDLALSHKVVALKELTL
jgi:hypothetical protein